jgi:hypothetical protein
MDSSCLRGMDGIEGAGVLRRLEPSLAVIMLSVFRDEDRVFRNADPLASEQEIASAEREEDFHRGTLVATGEREIDSRIAKLFLATPAARPFAAAMLRDRPYISGQSELAMEVAGAIAGGEWNQFGVTDAQAEHAWLQFTRLLISRYGRQAEGILDYGHPLHAEAVARRVRREIHEGVPGDDGGEGGSDAGGTEPLYRPNVRGGTGEPGSVSRSLDGTRSATEAPRQTEGRPHERGSSSLEFVSAGLSNLLKEEGPKGNYSGLGAFEDRFVRNLSQLEKANPRAHTDALKAAGSRGQTAVILRAAVPKIEEALRAAKGPSWDEFRQARNRDRVRLQSNAG